MATSIWKQKSDYNLGTLLLGADYDYLRPYVIGDVVTFNGQTFRAILDNPLVDGRSVIPRNSLYWERFEPEISEGDTFDIQLPVRLGSEISIDQTALFGGDATFTDFDDNTFYVSSLGLPGHAFGPYPNPQNSFPAKPQDWLFTIPRNPVVATTKTDLPVGAVGVAINGVPIYNHASATIDNVEGELLTRNRVQSIANGSTVNDGSGPPSVEGDYHYIKDPSLLYFKPTNYKTLYDGNRQYNINEIVFYQDEFWIANLENPGSISVNSLRVVTYGRTSKYGYILSEPITGFEVQTRSSGSVTVSATEAGFEILNRLDNQVLSIFERDWVQYISGVQHSPIIGYAFDGNPIYGSLGYSDPLDPTSYPTYMTSSYILRDDKRQNGDTRDGYYEQDWAYLEGQGTLDQYNGRFCITPEYPEGVYAYFASTLVENPTASTYPYLLGRQYYGEPVLPNGSGIREGLNDVEFTIISGSIPNGLRIERQRLRGTPLEVPNTIQYDFVIRAEYSQANIVEDRTFKLVVEGPDEPEWLTPEGNLPVGPNSTYYVLDGEFVDINLLATDADIAAGQTLEFFIGDNSGELPPGLTLTKEGRIFGFTEPVIPLDFDAVTGGGYDTDRYDFYPYDFAIKSESGYDSFLYDSVTYDEFDATRSPKKASRFYEFIVSVNDGDSIARRKFKIFVVGDDAARADNVSSKASQELFTADMTFVRKPIFITPADLGVKRAGNFITLVIDVYDPNTIIGPIDYQLEPINLDGSPSVLPTGLTLDNVTGEVAGRYPYQPEVTKQFDFTVRATRYNPNVADITVYYGYVALPFSIGDKQVYFEATNKTELLQIAGASTYDPINLKNIFVTAVDPVDLQNQNITVSVDRGGDGYDPIDGEKRYFNVGLVDVPERAALQDGFGARANITIKNGKLTSVEVIRGGFGYNVNDRLMPNPNDVPEFKNGNITLNSEIRVDTVSDGVVTEYVRATFSSALGFGIPELPTEPSVFAFSTTIVELDQDEFISERKQFSVKVQGAADGAINWITPSILGDIPANSISTLKVEAESTFPGTTVVYKLVDGRLPNGITLIEDGELIGKVRQFADITNPGITIFDNGFLTFDGTNTSFDRSYTFTVEAKDKFTINATRRTFTVNVTPLADRAYSNIFLKPFLKPEKKTQWNTFVSDSNVFSTDIIYRPYDGNFGIQRNLESLLYSGIESKSYGEFAAVTSKGHKPRSLRVGDIRLAEARNVEEGNITYEVVYLELLDPYERTLVTADTEDIQSAAETIQLNKKQDPITADQTNADFVKGTIDPNDALYNRDDPMFFRPDSTTLTVDSDFDFNASADIKYISTLTNMRERIKNIGVTDNRFLPLWMKTRQTSTGKQPGYVRAIPIAYCKPGKGQELLLKIRNYQRDTGFDFASFDYFVDRYIIDATLGNSNTQFIVWPKNNKSI